MLPIWIPLVLALIGTLLLTLFGLLWTREGSKVHDWGYRLGVILLLAGIALATVSI